jgi:hypothetical protein
MYPQIEIWIHAQFPAYYLNCLENLRPPYPANGAQIQLAVSDTSAGRAASRLSAISRP